ncbi:MAG: hypothetical protein IIB28_01190, partial [Chloroflexi bacterium]|nr:hypothetical protein [Chloroflexota bacterium]
MKLSAKLVTALAAIALLVVALAGVVSNSSTALAETSDATISLDKAWYTVPDTITITVTDPDSDTLSATSTTIDFDNDGAQFQTFTIFPNLGDTDEDGDVDGADFTLTETDVNGDALDFNASSPLSPLLFLNPEQLAAGFITIGRLAGVGEGDLPNGAGATTTVFILFSTDTLEELTNQVKVTSTQDPTGFLVSPIEGTEASGGVFEIEVNLVDATSTTELFVKNGDTITVTFEAGTSSSKDQAKVETTGPVIDVISPVDGFATQDQTVTFIVQISDNESGVDADTIRFNINGVKESFTDKEPDDTDTIGGVITAEFTTGQLVLDGQAG